MKTIALTVAWLAGTAATLYAYWRVSTLWQYVSFNPKINLWTTELLVMLALEITLFPFVVDRGMFKEATRRRVLFRSFSGVGWSWWACVSLSFLYSSVVRVSDMIYNALFVESIYVLVFPALFYGWPLCLVLSIVLLFDRSSRKGGCKLLSSAMMVLLFFCWCGHQFPAQ